MANGVQAAQDISGAAQDTSGAAQDTSGAAQGISGAAQGISGAAQDISGAAQDTSGISQETEATSSLESEVIQSGNDTAVNEKDGIVKSLESDEKSKIENDTKEESSAEARRKKSASEERNLADMSTTEKNKTNVVFQPEEVFPLRSRGEIITYLVIFH